VTREFVPLLALALVALLPAASVRAESAALAFHGARVLPSGLVVALGSASVDGAAAPLAVVVDSSGRVVSSFYLKIGGRGALLDAFLANGSLVAVGYVDSVVGRRAVLAVKVRGGKVEWSAALGSGFVDFARCAAPFGGGYALAGVTQPPGASDSDALLLFVDEGGALRGAYAVGAYMYNDFAERCYSAGGALLLVGSTWSHNVSYSDSLLIDAERGAFTTLGGAGRDEGFAAAVLQDGSVVVVGSTFSAPGGLSDAFYAVVREGSFKAFTVGWPGYDGFVDVCQVGGKLYVLGYSVQEGGERGLLFRAGESGFERGVALKCEGDLIPLAVGAWGEEVAAVFSHSGALVVVTFNSDLKPLRAFAVGYTAPPLVRVLEVKSVGQRSRAVEGLSLKSQALAPKRVELQSAPLAAELAPLDLPSRSVAVEEGVLEEGEPLWKTLLRLVEGNIPLLILAIPLAAVVIAVILKHRR